MTDKQEFSINPEEVEALADLSAKYPNGRLGVKRKVESLTDTVSYVELIVRIYGYTAKTHVWRNNYGKWVTYPDDCWDIW